jgi:AraC-like DNA-binding protein
MPRTSPNFAFSLTVVDGPCWFESSEQTLTRLEPGDSVLFLNGADHRYMSAPGAPLENLPEVWNRQLGELPVLGPGIQRTSPVRLEWGSGPVKTRILTLAFVVQEPARSPLLCVLPSTLLLRKSAGGLFPWLPSTLAFLADEETTETPGYVATATHLAELIFTSFIRAYALSTPVAMASWLRGLSDPGIGRALACIHGRPETRWTADRLAREAGMARSTFARRFTEFVGRPPIDYLIAWRMQLASETLLTKSRSVAAIAESLGYQSERAFRQAFKAHFGLSPHRHATARPGKDDSSKTS